MRMRVVGLKLISIICLLIVCFIAGKYALADYYFENAKTAYDAVDIQKLKYARELNWMINELDNSLSLRPNSADALDLKADLIYQSWWLSPDAQYFADSSLLQQAAQLHLEAQQYRQGWAFSAARLALIYSHQRQLDHRFDQWFLESHRLGLYEASIAYSLMVIGLKHWPLLSQQQQRLTEDFVRTSIEQKINSAQMMQSVLDQFNQREYFCGVLNDTPRKNSVCNSSS